MNPTDLLPAIGCLLAALAATWLMSQYNVISSPVENSHRYASIDGLRGYLAFFVFIHHSCVWYFYLQTGQWQTPPSSVYAYFGYGCVMLFFMVTGFLFFSKLIEGRGKGIDWCRLYTSRLLRIVPLYLFVVLLVFLIAAYLSWGELNVTLPELIRAGLGWLRFWQPKMHDLNDIKDTSIIIASVFWTLPFEWGFYFTLPFFAIMIGIKARPPIKYLILSLLGIHILMKDISQLIPFAGGVAAAYMVRNAGFRKFAIGKSASVLIIALLVSAVVYFPDPREAGAQFLLFAVFSLIASGNALFGVLTNKVSRLLGEVSFSIYMLHGVVLFATFNFLIGLPVSRSFSPSLYWLIIFGLSPVLVVLSFTTYKTIEHPSLIRTPKVTAWFYSLGRRGKD